MMMYYGICIMYLLGVTDVKVFLIKGVASVSAVYHRAIFYFFLLALSLFCAKFCLFNVVVRIVENHIGHLKVGDKNKILKARVYRRRIARNVPKPTPIVTLSTLVSFLKLVAPTEFVISVVRQQACGTRLLKTSLRFGRYTKFENIFVSGFLEHFFNFVSYNQLEIKIPQPDSRGRIQHPVLTVSDLVITRYPNKRQSVRGKVDIENLDDSGNITEFAMWDDMAWEFDRNLVETMEAIIIIGVTSCRVSQYRERGIGIIYRAPSLPGKVKENSGMSEYSFKAFVSNRTGTTIFTLFTQIADGITRHKCTELFHKLGIPNPQHMPPVVLAIEGRKHMFPFHFNASSKIGAVDFTLDDVLDKPASVSGKMEPSKCIPGSYAYVHVCRFKGNVCVSDLLLYVVTPPNWVAAE
ncbi:hypothetical protein Tco_1314185 [Tanacetum coccineum]